MFWKTKDNQYLALGITASFSCWGKADLDEFGEFDRSSSYLLLDKDGNLLKTYFGSTSTSIEDEFHITDIHFVSNNQLIRAHYINEDMTTERSKTTVLLSDLTPCTEMNVPISVIEAVNKFRTT